MSERLGHRGYALVPQVLDDREVRVTGKALERIGVRGAGTRALLNRAWCCALVARVKARLISVGAMPSSHVAVQCTLFDKTAKRNWLVPLHQDLSVPVKRRIAHADLQGWSRKEGSEYVQPPAKLLEQMLVVRLHIDGCGADEGPLRVVAGSHSRGRLNQTEAAALRDLRGEDTCLAASGDALLMRPLILHASSKARRPSRRRVLHVVFGPFSLPYGLEWNHVV